MDLHSTRGGAELGDVYIAASFTAEPLRDPLCDQLSGIGLSATVDFAPFGQVFQELLAPAAAIRSRAPGVNVLLVRAEDFLSKVGEESPYSDTAPQHNSDHTERLLNSFSAALAELNVENRRKSVVVVCPSLTQLSGVDLSAVEDRIVRDVAACPSATIILPRDFQILHPRDVFDLERNEIAQIPFTSRYFASLAQLLSLRLAYMAGHQRKLIALDADGTLWQGVCGEQDPCTLTITPAQRRFQELLRQARQQGTLLALISKNNPQDVDRVFAEHPDMVLSREDFVAMQVNWQPKSANVNALAQNLNLAPESFVFVDDNVVELADVASHYPGVVLLPVPSLDAMFEAVLDRVDWLFSGTAATYEDMQRTQLYISEEKRRTSSRAFGSLDEFVESLRIEVTFFPIGAENIHRAAQLTARTNQFNLRKIVRSPEEIERSVGSQGHGFIVQVRDAFGDYGLTALVIASHERTDHVLLVDTFLLSCRVLGRCIEYSVLRKLADTARESGCSHVCLPLTVSEKNAPIQQFLSKHFENYAQDPLSDSKERRYLVPVQALDSLRLPASMTVHERSSSDSPVQKNAPSERSDPATNRETLDTLLGLVGINLGLERSIDASESYFDLGGNSLRAVDLVSVARRRGLHVSLDDVITSPVLEELAKRVRRSDPETTTERAREPFYLLSDEEKRFVDRKFDLLDVDDSFPLSRLQQGMVYHASRQQDAHLYINVLCWDVESAWNEKAFLRALRWLQKRHQALRSVFCLDAPDRPLQIVKARTDVDAEVRDLKHLDRSEQDDVLRQWVKERQRGIDCAVSPWRIAVHIRSANAFHLSLVVHHALLDGWSNQRFVTELLSAYRRCANQDVPETTLEPPSYARLVELELRALQDGIERKWWRRQVANAALPFWTGAKRSHSIRLYQSVSPQLERRIESLAKKWGVQEKSLWCSVYFSLLAALAGRERLCGASVVHSRPELENVADSLGVYLNSLPLSVDLRGKSWRGIAQDLNRSLQSQFQHRFYPCAQIGFDTGLDFSASLFNFIQVTSAQETGHRVSGLGCESTNILFTFSVEKAAARDLKSHIVLDVDAEVFSGQLRQRLIPYVQRILESIERESTSHFRIEEILDESERSRQLFDWNPRGGGFPEGCVHEIVGMHGGGCGDRIALVEGCRQLSYGELERRANRVANYLVGRGVKAESRVGVCVNRSLEMVIGMLGILKAGGAYVPLDASYPPARLKQMIEVSECELILSERSVQREFEWLGEYASVALDAVEEGGPWAGYGYEAPRVQVDAHQLAYVIFTSGSTGVPKAIGVTHRNIVRLIFNRFIPFEELERYLCAASASFDAITFELWGALLHAKKAVLFELKRSSFAGLGEVIGQQGVEAAWLTAGLFNQVIVNEPLALRGLKYLLVGGEALSKEHIQRARQVHPHLRLINGYGPTENTTFSCTYEIRHREVTQWVSIPIGQPIDHSTAYILSEQGSLLPTGCVGELYVGGEGVARGYLNQAGLTAQKFVPDPFSDRAGARLYRTGDLARWNEQGEIEFIGRADHQVKLRGFRIELSEIESVCLQHDRIRDAVAVIREDTEQHPQIVVYVAAYQVEGKTHPLSHMESMQLTAGLREHLQHRLPDYMVPSSFVVLHALPLTVNGKVDRAALPAPDVASASHTADRPIGDVEIRLAALWQQLLKRTPVGRHDNFFELGGQSLLAMQLAVRVRDVFGAELSLEDIFGNSSLSALALCISRVTGVKRVLPLIPEVNAAGAQLSYSQQRLWFLAQLEGASPTYNIPKVFRLGGSTDTARLQRALQTIVDRHDALRTSFDSDGGKPFAVIDACSSVSLPVESVNTIERWNEVCNQESGYLFDVQAGPLYRFKFVRRKLKEEDEQCFLLATFHHSIFDGYSVSIFLTELEALYTGLESNSPQMLAPLPLQFSAVAHWQRQRLESGELKSQEEYWRNQLAQLPTCINLPSDRPRPGRRSLRGSWVEMHVDHATTSQLRMLARERGSTLYMALLAAFSIVLHRYSGQNDLAIGTPTANRPFDGLEKLIGFFVNTLVIRCSPSDEKTFIEILDDIRDVVLKALANQDIPFDFLVEQLNPVRSVNVSPLFQVMFALQDENETLPSNDAWAQDLDLLAEASHERRRGVAHFDLTLLVKVTPRGLHCKLEYAQDMFDASSVQGILESFCMLLKSVVRLPGKSVAAFEVIGSADRDRQIAQWNHSADSFASDKCVYELFQRQTELTPDAIALVHEPCAVSFRELNNRANFLARKILSFDLPLESKVGLHFERSIETVIGVLAVIKAGLCYVPLDPAHPLERTRFTAADANVRLILSNVDHLDSSLVDEYCILNVPSALRGEYTSRSQYADIPRAAIGLQPDNLVYCLYTSGSTGRPKGVMVTHAALANLCLDSIRRRGFNGECRNLQFAPLGFDAASAEIFNSLLSGSILHIPPTNVLTDAEEFRRYSKRHAINRGYIPPAFLSILDSRDFASYRSLSVGGEPIAREIAKRWSQVCTLTNAYGPTECTIACTSGTLDGGAEEVSIGRFIANVGGYVLNDALQLVPIGAVGELCIGGACLARGYASDRKLTAARFIPDPFATKPGSRLYRTGDLVRYRRDGNLEFLGRKDQQIKLRGHRIELGEIEACVTAHPEVKVAVASVQGAASEQRIVVHYTTRDPEATLSSAALRAFAKQKLPHYMVPSALSKVREFPLTQSGKIDRKSLPTLQDYEHCEKVAPVGELEMRVAALWAETLAVRSVGRFDNFFELGGHSLLAAQLVASARERFKANIAVRDLFENQSLERFAAVIENRFSTELSLPWRNSDDAPRDGAALSPAQKRLWFLHKFIGRNSVFNIPVALKLKGSLRPSRLSDAIAHVLVRHEVLRSRIVEVGGEPRTVIDSVPTEVLRIVAVANEQELQRVCLAEKTTPFDLSADALYRFCLISIDDADRATQDQTWVLHLTLHHIVSDGRSIGIMLHEIATHYNGNEPAEQPPAFQYGEFAAWQSGPQNRAIFDDQLTYWRTALRGLPPTLNMPLDFPRPREQTFNGATRRLQLPLPIREQLKSLSRSQNATLFMTLISAFALLLSRYARQSQFAIGTPISSRELAGSEGVIGLFLNMLVLRFDVNARQSFLQLLQSTRATALDAYLHQDIPFESLVEQLNPERDLGHTPFFQVSFSMVENPLSGVRFHELDATLQEPDASGTVARYELSFSFTELEDGLLGTMEYNSDLFAADTIEQMLAHYRILLEAIVATPNRPVDQLHFLSTSEQQRQLSIWNTSPSDVDVEGNVYQLLKPRVAEAPDAIAVGCDGCYFSYRQLDNAAHAVASALQARGCGVTSRVGIALDRSFEMLAAVLGCLRSGITYVPLDLQLPTARVAYIAADAKLDLVIGDVVAAGPSNKRISAAQLRETICCNPNTFAAVTPPAAHLAYVIYTSGSTGKPKGVGVSHGNLINLVKAVLRTPGIEERDRLLAVTTLSFDIAFLELFVPIAAGGMVEIALSEDVYDGKKLFGKVAGCSISCMQATPSTWKLMLDAGWRGTASLKALVGGEALPRELAGRLKPHVEQLWNMYGPTETTIWSTARLIDSSRIDIGRPLRNTTAYVLSETFNLVPIGVVGELYIGGQGVAQGYVERPSLTATRFIPNPFADETCAGSRLYRTGDLVRYRDDGNLEYIGREDHQVKIRGHRIELAEIEAAMLEHSAVKEAVVIACKGAQADEYLAAYLVLHENRDLPLSGIASELRDIVQKWLPRYMVPSAFVVLDKLPLTPNGKLDRNALPAPEAVAPATEYVAPRDQFEKRIARIWADILKRERVGLTDNFFELGGHSLLVTQVASRIEAEFDIAISLKDFYEFSSLQAISARVNHLTAIDAVDAGLVEQLSDDEVRRLLSEIEALETPSTHEVCER